MHYIYFFIFCHFNESIQLSGGSPLHLVFSLSHAFSVYNSVSLSSSLTVILGKAERGKHLDWRAL